MDDVDPLPPLTLYEARLYASRLLEFVVVINNEYVKMAGPNSKHDHPHDLDALVQALRSVNETTHNRQASLLNWDVLSGSTGSSN